MHSNVCREGKKLQYTVLKGRGMLLFMKSRQTGYYNVFRLAITPAANPFLLLYTGILELCMSPSSKAVSSYKTFGA